MDVRVELLSFPNGHTTGVKREMSISTFERTPLGSPQRPAGISMVFIEEGSEEGRAGREGVKGASAEARTAVEQEQEAGHPLGWGEQGRVAENHPA